MKEFAAVTSIEFSPIAPYDFAVSSSTRVQIYSADRCNVKKSVTRFKDLAYGSLSSPPYLKGSLLLKKKKTKKKYE